VKAPCILLILLFLILSFLPAGEESSGARISAVRVMGLKRTKPQAAEKPLRKFIGTEAAALDPREVRAAVMDTGILEPLEAEVLEENGRWILQVVVREKWSVFPLPMVMGGSGGWSFGGFFADTNAFGLNDKFFLGGMYGRQAWLVTGGYMHAPMGEMAPGWRLTGSFSRQERRDTDQKDRDLRSFDLDSVSGGGGLSYEFLDFLTASLNLSYENQMLRNREKAVNGPAESAWFLGIGTGLAARRSSWDGYLLSEESASADYAWNAGFGAPSFHSLRLRGTWEKSLIPGFRLKFRAGGIWAPGVPALQEPSPASAVVNILPPNYRARHFAGTSLGLEKYLFKFSLGTLSFLASWQGVWSDGSVLENQFDQGVAGMLSFYLSRLAIPAFAVGAAYNITAAHFQGSFSLGMSF
jgi:hypothetical protein